MRRYYASLWWMNFKPIELLDQQKVCYGVSSVLLSLLAIFFFWCPVLISKWVVDEAIVVGRQK